MTAVREAEPACTPMTTADELREAAAAMFCRREMTPELVREMNMWRRVVAPDLPVRFVGACEQREFNEYEMGSDEQVVPVCTGTLPVLVGVTMIGIDPIDAACPRCKGRQPHTIVALMYGLPDHVMCNTCRKHHNLATIDGDVDHKRNQT